MAILLQLVPVEASINGPRIVFGADTESRLTRRLEIPVKVAIGSDSIIETSRNRKLTDVQCELSIKERKSIDPDVRAKTGIGFVTYLFAPDDPNQESETGATWSDICRFVVRADPQLFDRLRDIYLRGLPLTCIEIWIEGLEDSWSDIQWNAKVHAQLAITSFEVTAFLGQHSID